MTSKNIIPIEQFCKYYEVPVSFVSDLNTHGLIEIITIKKVQCISITQIRAIEKMMRLHYDLDINIEGVDAIYNLLKQIESLQNEVTRLHNRLQFYEDSF